MSAPSLAGLLLGLALVAGVVGACAGPGAAPGPAGGAEPSRAAARPPVPSVSAAPARRAASVVVPEPPRSTRLPSGRLVPVRAVSTARGTLDVPTDITTAGWWRGGSRLGDPFGSMLVAAHVDSTTQGLGPYAELLSVRAGQRVTVTSRHYVQRFVVRARRLVPQGPLTGQPWIFSAHGRPRLTLVTCAPPYDRSRGGYQRLAVVTAVPDGRPVRRS